VPRLRLSRWHLQAHDAPGKIAPGYDRARRCSPLPQSGKTPPTPPTPQVPQAPQRQTTFQCAAKVGVVVGSAGYLAAETPGLVAVGSALLRGATVGAEIGEFAGPQGLLIGAALGGIVGGAVYYYDLGGKVPSNSLAGCP
jgi:hypothetical protein